MCGGVGEQRTKKEGATDRVSGASLENFRLRLPLTPSTHSQLHINNHRAELRAFDDEVQHFLSSSDFVRRPRTSYDKLALS